MKHKSKKREILKHLEDNSLVSIACSKVGISRSTYYRWREEDPDFKKATAVALETGIAKMNDYVVSKLLENIKDNNQPAIAYWLRFNHPRYKPEVLRLVIEENKQQLVEFKKLQQLMDELINLVGVDKLLEAAVPDPQGFKEKVRKGLEVPRRRSDKL
jgi:hypothetical protein